jgi:cof-like hydrolase
VVGAHPKGDMMTIKLIATDMDGTLLDQRGQLDLPRLEKILDQLDQRDIRFVIATGNEVHRMRQLLEHLASRVVLVVANGARIFENNRLIQAQTWDDAMVDKALFHFKGRECRDQFVVTGMKGGFVKKGTVFTDLEKFMTPEMIEKFYQRMNFVEDLQAALFGGVLKMSMVVGKERSSSVLQEINDLFNGRVRAVSSGYGCIDILQAGVHKAWGLEELLKRWNLKSEQIMAFGDSENDVEMLELAGIAYAMENADDNVKVVATALAPANSKAGVYQVLENWLEKEG